MSLKLRRGTNAQRIVITPAEGELIYTTDTKKLYVGDGLTAGGVAVDTSGGGGILLSDLSIGPENSPSGDGSISYDNTTGIFNYTPPVIPVNLTDLNDVSSPAPTTNQVLKFNGSSWSPANDTGITDIVQDTSPQLGGNLDTNGYNINIPGDMFITSNTSTGVIATGRLFLGATITRKSVLVLAPMPVPPTGSLSDPLDNINNPGVTYIGDPTYNYDGNLCVIRNNFTNNINAGMSLQQFHETQDAVNFNFIRARGTNANPQIVQNGDVIGDIGFLTFDGSSYTGAGIIRCAMDDTPGLNKLPGRISIFTRPKSGQVIEAFRVNSSQEVAINKLSGLSSNVITINTNTNILIGDIKLNQDGLSTVNSNANLYLSANSAGRIYLDNMAWPTGDGLSGQVLTTDGAGSLSWTTVSGGGGSSFSRTTVVGSTSSIGIGVSENVNITGASKGYLLYKIQVNEPAWVRIYVSDSARTADSSRAEGVDPAPGSGVIAEVITSSTNQVVLISPGTIGFNDEPTVDSTIFLRVTNKAYPTAITSTLTIVSLET